MKNQSQVVGPASNGPGSGSMAAMEGLCMGAIVDYPLSPGESNRLRDAIWDEAVEMTGAPQKVRLAMAQRFARVNLPMVNPQFAYALKALRDPAGPAAILVHGLPVDAVTHATPVAEYLSLILGSCVGEPFQYAQQPDGLLVARLEPVPGKELIANTGQSRQDFQPHTDFSIYAPWGSPGWLLLLGVKNECATWTGYTPLSSVLPQVSLRSKLIACDNRFVVQAPASLGVQPTPLSKPRRMLWREHGQWRIALPSYWIRPADPADEEAAACIAEFVAAFTDPDAVTRIVVGPGTALFFRNHGGLHSRGPVSGDRLVLRTYVTGHLPELQRITGETGPFFDARKLQPRFGQPS